MAEHPTGWNVRVLHCLPCGCVTGVTALDALSPEGQAECVLQSLKAGYTLRLVAWDDAGQSFHCARYPHEAWQVAYERRLQAFASGAKGAAVDPHAQSRER